MLRFPYRFPNDPCEISGGAKNGTCYTEYEYWNIHFSPVHYRFTLLITVRNAQTLVARTVERVLLALEFAVLVSI